MTVLFTFFTVKAGGMRVKPARVYEEAKKEQEEAKEPSPWETENAHRYGYL